MLASLRGSNKAGLGVQKPQTNWREVTTYCCVEGHCQGTAKRHSGQVGKGKAHPLSQPPVFL